MMNDTNLETLRGIINEWVRKEEWPEDISEANVQSIYKKGDPNKPEKYRPISLLNSICKIVAGTTKMRIERGVEEKLQSAQYGFRKVEAHRNRFSW